MVVHPRQGEDVTAERKKDQREYELELDDLPQLEPERIDELPPRVLDLAQVPPPRDRVEIRRVFLIEPRLRRHDEEHHKRQDREEREKRPRHRHAPRPQPDEEIRQEDPHRVENR